MKILSAGPKEKTFINRPYNTEIFYVNEKHEKENIDFLNPWYCELTGLYYLNKHYKDNIMGLDQYRRAFNLNETQIIDKLNNFDIITHSTNIEPYSRIWYLNKGFGYGSLQKEIAEIYAVIKYLYPDIINSYIDALRSKQSCQHNMFICKKEIFDLYCNFVFSILNTYIEIYNIKDKPLRFIGHIFELTGLNTFINYYKLKNFNAPIIWGK